MNFFKVSHTVHIALSAFLWSFFGIDMNYVASKWLFYFENEVKIYLIIIGVLLGLSMAIFLFSKIVKRNINRIKKLPERSNILLFQSLKSYILIAFMISLGITMRKSGLVPVYILCPMYITIGVALFISGCIYYKELVKRKIFHKKIGFKNL
jgi:hypothetical protein